MDDTLGFLGVIRESVISKEQGAGSVERKTREKQEKKTSLTEFTGSTEERFFLENIAYFPAIPVGSVRKPVFGFSRLVYRTMTISSG